jgi:pimeloyl-ACP methyl ester carboxylesterase
MKLDDIRVNGAELHYLERGTGQPLVLIHGGLGDYRSWDHQLPALSQHFRVVSYSRRYSYPNANRVIAPDHSVFTEADDLAALITRLELGRVHLVGHSYGAFTALVLGLKRPRTVRTLVLAEPPVHGLIRSTAEGGDLFDQIGRNVWRPVKAAFERGDPHDAVRIFTDGIGGPGYFESLPANVRAARLENARALRALLQSSDSFPPLPAEALRGLAMPTLIVEGEKTIRIHQLVDDELLHYIPAVSA